MDRSELQQLHEYCSHHAALLEESVLAGCFYCENTFPPTDIKEWIDKGDTALCPKCGIDSVLPSATVELTIVVLAAMNDYWFSRGE